MTITTVRAGATVGADIEFSVAASRFGSTTVGPNRVGSGSVTGRSLGATVGTNGRESGSMTCQGCSTTIVTNQSGSGTITCRSSSTSFFANSTNCCSTARTGSRTRRLTNGPVTTILEIVTTFVHAARVTTNAEIAHSRASTGIICGTIAQGRTE